MVLPDKKATEVQDGVNTLGNSGTVKRVEGDDWKAYKVGENMIRVDIQTDKE